MTQWSDDAAAQLLEDVADAVAGVVGNQRDWTLADPSRGQYHADLAADAAAMAVLDAAAVGVVS
jgi:hypothetical protein